jgi:uncharacterized protein YndB with AHSA1/START domain
MNAKSNVAVRVTHRFQASPERVFDAWLDPERAGKWLFATPSGKMVKVEIDARVGGSFCFVDRRDGEDVAHNGKYVEIDRPRRLVFTIVVPKYSSEVTRVSIDIVPLGSGCELTLTHEGVLADYVARTESGWAKILEELAATLSHKQAAITFLQLVASGKVREAYRAHVGPGFRHHNVWFRGDAESLMTAMEEAAAKNPDKQLEVQRALQEGELVAVHSRVRQNSSDRGGAVVHIFRFAGERIVELWDVGQAVPEESPNEHGMF